MSRSLAKIRPLQKYAHLILSLCYVFLAEEHYNKRIPTTLSMLSTSEPPSCTNVYKEKCKKEKLQAYTHGHVPIHFKSHHPTYVKKGLVRCLYDRARNITKEASNLETECLAEEWLPGSLSQSSIAGK